MKYSFEKNYSDKKLGPIQRLSAKKKIIFLFCTLPFMVLTPWDMRGFFLFYLAGVLFLILLAKLPFKFIFLKILKLLPFLCLISFSLLFKEGGIQLFFLAMVKSLLALILTSITFSTSSFSDIMAALRKLKVPYLFIETISLMRRYLYVFEDILAHTKRGFDSRNTGRAGYFEKISIFSNILAIMLIKAFEKAQKVYMAMKARGYDEKFCD